MEYPFLNKTYIVNSLKKWYNVIINEVKGGKKSR